MPFYVLIIVAIVCIVVTALVTLTVRKNTVEKKVGNAEEKAREIIDDALKVAERSKREALLEAKEESLKTKNELDKETKERRAELQRYERRVLAKEETLDKKSDALELTDLILGSVIAHCSVEDYHKKTVAENHNERKEHESEKSLCKENGNESRDEEKNCGEDEYSLTDLVEKLAEQDSYNDETDNSRRAADDYGRGYLEGVEVKLEIVLNIDEYVGHEHLNCGVEDAGGREAEIERRVVFYN